MEKLKGLQVEFTKSADDSERYEHVSRVLKRFDYPRQARERCAAEVPESHQRLTSDFFGHQSA